jgi:YggT family protein
MPNDYLSTPLIFLVETLFGLYIGIIALRLIMQWAQWEYHNPLVQFIIKATQVPVKFLRGFIPSLGGIDTATVVFLFLATFIKIGLLALLQSMPFSVGLLIRLVLADIFSLFITLFTVSIIIQAILSWIGPQNNHNPVTPLISRMNAPLLRPVRSRLPLMGGIDLSPLVVILGLQLLSMLVLPLLVGHYY